MKHITRNKENEVDYITGNLLPKKNLQEAQKIKRMHCWTPQFKREKHGGDLCFWSLLCHYEAFKSDAWLQNTKYKCKECSLDVQKIVCRVSKCMCAKETRTKHRELIHVPSQLLNFENRDWLSKHFSWCSSRGVQSFYQLCKKLRFFIWS